MKFWPRGQYTWLHPRLEVSAPQWEKGRWWRVWCGHGGDEYGNCSYHLTVGLLGGFVIFPFSHFQRDVLLPEPGENDWVDRVYHREFIEAIRQWHATGQLSPEPGSGTASGGA